MTCSRLLLGIIVISCTATAAAAVEPPPADKKLPMCGLTPSKIIPNLGLLQYRISTTSKECQEFFDQGLNYHYSYVWMEAARSFETAAHYDPDCALVWWGLSRALEKWGKPNHTQALQKAGELQARASHREQQLILARMQEHGLAPNSGDATARKQKAVATIDTMLTLYDDDEEGWFYRAHLAGGTGFGGVVSAVPFYKALLRVNPLHPGANHELVHFYENSQRPALGWQYAEGYIKSAPGIPHPFHMQAHLAMRLGRWDKTTDRSSHAIELEHAYHKEMNVQPKDDHQYSHHLEILTTALIHDARYAEARACKEEAEKLKYTNFQQLWFRMHLGEGDWAAAEKVIDGMRRRDKQTTSYMRAILALRQGDAKRAAAEVEVLRQAYQERKNDRQLELRLWETQGLLMCHQGDGDAGVKLLARCVEKTKDSYQHHAWGHGAQYMLAWGNGALKAGKLDVAEEAFLEALAHDPGNARAALGMQVICDRQGRSEEAQRFLAIAQKSWSKANPDHVKAEWDFLKSLVPPLSTQVEAETNLQPTPAAGKK
jgi:tetratricopeptide (TPR) repeat protein